ncbi:MAG: FAD-binding protein [Sphingobacteriaceae bacterium]|nr:FAD-binding protein [Sphingobacteriaceae bacterium]
MIHKIQIQTSPQNAINESLIKQQVRNELGLDEEIDLSIKISKRSVDARGRKIKINLSIEAAVDEALSEFEFTPIFKDVSSAKKNCHIIGAGPAGLFAALRCLENGIKPILFERGKTVKDRRRDLAAINKEHLINPESNYCFGEGGAGTYSDGKLYTRSGKRGSIEKILKLFVYHGASQEILIDAHPHIGTNKLPALIENIRKTILDFGGEIYFNSKLEDIEIKNNIIHAIQIKDQFEIKQHAIQQLILATGHSARDIYELLNKKGVLLEMKPFAIGVRVEHSQSYVDAIQYHCNSENELKDIREYLPAASYSLVEQVNGRGVYSFCMCPGGIIAPCATAQEEIVTNGWSPSKRNNPYANSGIVVGVNEKDFEPYKEYGALAGLEFQKYFEHKAWIFGGKTQTAPAQALADFVQQKQSSVLPTCSYVPGVKSVDMHELLEKELSNALKLGFKSFDKKMRNYVTNEAVIVGVESRTSTPVRIPRDKELCAHPQIRNLYPCGEGAGFAGGIVSAAMDGERCADAILNFEIKK